MSRSATDSFPGVTSEWTRPRLVSRVMEAVGLAPTQRLHQGTFEELVRRVESAGIELSTVDGDPVRADHRNIGAASKVRLRRRGKRRQVTGSTARRGPTDVERPPRPVGEAILSSITIGHFKSFVTATLPLSELTLLIGANASGKSNALEALQLLSWMAKSHRLYDLAGAVRDGQLALRGRALDLAWQQSAERPIHLECALEQNEEGRSLQYEIDLGISDDSLRVVKEVLRCPEEVGDLPLYRVVAPARQHSREIAVEYNNFARGKNKPQIGCVDEQPVFMQLLTPARFGASHEKSQRVIPVASRRIRDALSGILFLDPNPRAMREYSYRSQPRLAGDGSNVSGVLYGLTQGRDGREKVLAFVRELPERDIRGLDYVQTPRGEVMVKLEESFGIGEEWREAAVLSDGTLRVLAIAAALLSVQEGSLVVIEEIDNGVHPARAQKLLQQIREVSTRRRLRILLTTHNAALLDAIPTHALPNVVACFRDPEDGTSKLARLSDLESYPELIAAGRLGQLATSGSLDRHLKRGETADQRTSRALQWLDSTLGRSAGAGGS